MRLEETHPEVRSSESSLLYICYIDDITQRLTDLLAIQLEMLEVKSVLYPWTLARAAFRLHDLVGMMDGDMLDPACMYIYLWA
jgi:hypothetical protein